MTAATILRATAPRGHSALRRPSLAQQRKFAAQLVEHGHKSRSGRAIRRFDFVAARQTLRRSSRSAHREDAAAVRRAASGSVRVDSSFFFVPRLAPDSSGHGLSVRAAHSLPTFCDAIDRTQRTHMVHITAQGSIIRQPQSKFNRSDQRRRRHDIQTHSAACGSRRP